MEYTVVNAFSVSELIDKVNHLLNHGWVCKGGIAINISEDAPDNYFQAMVQIDDQQAKEQ